MKALANLLLQPLSKLMKHLVLQRTTLGETTWMSRLLPLEDGFGQMFLSSRWILIIIMMHIVQSSQTQMKKASIFVWDGSLLFSTNVVLLRCAFYQITNFLKHFYSCLFYTSLYSLLNLFHFLVNFHLWSQKKERKRKCEVQLGNTYDFINVLALLL